MNITEYLMTLQNESTARHLTTESLIAISNLLPVLENIHSEVDAQTYVRIHLDAINLKDRESFYDALAEFDSRFRDIFVARIPLPASSFRGNYSVRLPGGRKLCTEIRKNNYYGILEIWGETLKERFIVESKSFTIGGGTFSPANCEQITQEVIANGYYGILEIRTEKYMEPVSPLKLVSLAHPKTQTKKYRTELVNTDVFPVD